MTQVLRMIRHDQSERQSTEANETQIINLSDYPAPGCLSGDIRPEGFPVVFSLL